MNYNVSLHQYLGNVFFAGKYFQEREDLLLKAKRVRIASVALGALASVSMLQSLARGNIAIFSSMIAYASYETWTVSNNVIKTIENPDKEVQLALALYQSGETAVRKLSEGAPVLSELFVYLAKRYDMAGPPMVIFKKQLLEFCRQKAHMSVDEFFSKVLTPYLFREKIKTQAARSEIVSQT